MKSYSICRANRRHGSDYWYGRINEDGRVRFVSLRKKRKSEAAEWLATMNARRFMPEAADTGWRTRGVRETAAAFLRSVEASRGAGSSTAVSYANRLAVLEAFCAEARVETLGGFTRETGQGFADALAARNYAPKTARELLRCAAQFFRWAADTYEIRDFDPFARVARPKLARRRKDFWTPEQVDGILDAAPSPRVRLFWAFMAFAGLRHAEACAVGPESIADGTTAPGNFRLDWLTGGSPCRQEKKKKRRRKSTISPSVLSCSGCWPRFGRSCSFWPSGLFGLFWVRSRLFGCRFPGLPTATRMPSFSASSSWRSFPLSESGFSFRGGGNAGRRNLRRSSPRRRSGKRPKPSGNSRGASAIVFPGRTDRPLSCACA